MDEANLLLSLRPSTLEGKRVDVGDTEPELVGVRGVALSSTAANERVMEGRDSVVDAE